MAGLTYEPYKSKHSGKVVDAAVDKVNKDIPNEIGILNESVDKVKQDLTEKISAYEKGKAGGVATLDDSGLIPSKQLPSYVDDTIEGTLGTFPTPGERGKIYVDTETNMTYRWSGTTYINISNPIKFGESADTAYPGDKGKENADAIKAMEEILNGKLDFKVGYDDEVDTYTPTDKIEIYKIEASSPDGSIKQFFQPYILICVPAYQGYDLFVWESAQYKITYYGIEKRAYLAVDTEIQFGEWQSYITGNEIADHLTFDNFPTADSSNLLTSGTIYNEFETLTDVSVQDTEPEDSKEGDIWIDTSEEGGSGGGGSSVTVVDNLESKSPTEALSANQGRVLNEKINSYHDKVNDTVVFKYMHSVSSSDQLPHILQDSDAGKVYNILNKMDISYDIWLNAMGVSSSSGKHLAIQIPEDYKCIYESLKVGDNISLEYYIDQEPYQIHTAIHGFYGEDTIELNEVLADDGYHEAIGKVLLVTTEGCLKVDAGDNIVWTGYSWDNLSGSFEVETTDEVTEGNALPVTSNAVYAALKENIDYINAGTCDPSDGLISELSINDAGKIYKSVSKGAINYSINVPSAGHISCSPDGSIVMFELETFAAEAIVNHINIPEEISLYTSNMSSGFDSVQVSYIEYNKNLQLNLELDSTDDRIGIPMTLIIPDIKLSLNKGDFIIWNGYAWDKVISDAKIEVTNTVAENNNLPVTSNAVYEALGDIETALTTLISEQESIIAEQESILAIQNNYIAMSDTVALGEALDTVITEQDELIGGNA